MQNGNVGFPIQRFRISESDSRTLNQASALFSGTGHTPTKVALRTAGKEGGWEKVWIDFFFFLRIVLKYVKLLFQNLLFSHAHPCETPKFVCFLL